MSTLHIRKIGELLKSWEGHYFLASVKKLFSIQRTISLLEQLYAFWSRIFPVLSGEANPVTAVLAVRHASQYWSSRRTPWGLEPCQTTFWGLKSNFVMLFFFSFYFMAYFSEQIGVSLANEVKAPEPSLDWPHVISPSSKLFLITGTSSWTRYVPPHPAHTCSQIIPCAMWTWTFPHEVLLSKPASLSFSDRVFFLILQRPLNASLYRSLLDSHPK